MPIVEYKMILDADSAVAVSVGSAEIAVTVEITGIGKATSPRGKEDMGIFSISKPIMVKVKLNAIST